MGMKSIAVLIVGIIVVSSSALIAVDLLKENPKDITQDNANDPDNTVPKVEHSITYVLYDGVNSEDNPDKYTEGVVTKLYAASKEGYVFLGWSSDDKFETEITEISKTSTEDITLYACWEESEVGKCYTYTISGNKIEHINGFVINNTPLSGSVTYTYLHYKYGRGYYVGYDETITLGTGNDATTNYYSNERWSGDSDTVWTKGENATIDTIHGSKECNTWISTTSNSKETQYIGIDDDITYLVEYQKTDNDSFYTTAHTLSYTLSKISTTEIEDSFTVDVYCDKDIKVTGYGELDAYETVKLKATGNTFAGWYTPSGTLLSTSKTYTIDTLSSDVTIYARNNNNAELSFDSTTVTVTPDVALTNVTWTLNDNGNEITRTGNTLTYTYSQGGAYVVLYNGTDVNGNTYRGLYDVIVDGFVLKTYSWRYNNTNYTASLNIMYSDFLLYRNSTISRSQGTTAHDVSFVTYEDPYIVNLLGQIQAQCYGQSDAYTANVILAFTQYIEYKEDSVSIGQGEYWKYPLETLFDECGDCEDTTFLFCALAKAAGYDCAIFIYDGVIEGHAAAGINMDGLTGYYNLINNYRYYFCETTKVGLYVGVEPNLNGLWLVKTMPIS